MVEAASSKKSRHVFMIRHGERCDATEKYYKLYKNNGDACLTPTGWKQAAETGEAMKKTIADIEAEMGKPFDEVIIQSSPFVRVMGTAARVAKALG